MKKQLTFGIGPVVRVAPGEVDVTDVSAVKTIHTVKATYIKSPKFYRSLSAPGVESVFSTTDASKLFHRLSEVLPKVSTTIDANLHTNLDLHASSPPKAFVGRVLRVGLKVVPAYC